MQFDQQSIEQRLVNSLSAKSEWADLLFFGTNRNLLSTNAEGNAQLARYIEYLVRETKWSLARNISSLMYQAAAHNYTPHRKNGAVGSVRLSSDEAFTTPPSTTIDIPKYSIFSTDAGVQVTSISASNIVSGVDAYVDIDVVQGTPKTFSTTALGNINEVISIVNSSIENNQYELFVNGVLWTEINELRVADSSAEVYQIRNKPDFSGIDILFGDDLNGVQLSAGDVIQFKYLETLGVDGNIAQIGKVTNVDSVIYDTGLNTVEVFVTNLDSIVGGEDVETIEELRAQSPLTFQSAERAITRNDYKAILNATPQVLKSTVWGVYEINEDAGTPGTYISDEENYVYIAAISSAGGNLGESAKTTLREYLQDFKSATDVVNFQDVVFVYLQFNTDVYVSNRSLVLSEIKSRVISAIEGQYVKENLDFNENIPESDYQAFIDNLEGVDYHDTTIELVNFLDFNTSQFEAGTTLLLPELEPSSLQVYVKHKTEQTDSEWQLVATDDGSNSFDDSGTAFSVNPVGSSVNYTTGEFGIVVSTGLPIAEFSGSTYEDYELKVEYQIVDNNLTLQSRAQIFDLYKANVTIQYTR